MDEDICYPCDVNEGCYSCSNNDSCKVCIGGYLLNDDALCEIMTVQADEQITAIKFKSFYINETSLSHTLLPNSMKYVQKNYTLEEWRNSSDIIMQEPDFKLYNLTINHVEWISET